MTQNRTAFGVAMLCLGVFVFSLQDAVIKSVSGSYALTEVVSIRCLVSAPILLAFVWWENRSLKPLLSPQALSLAARSAIMLLAYTSYYMAFPALPLADAVALYFTVPLFMLALAAPLLGEIITPRKIVAALIGFAGVLVMLRPGLGVFEPAALLSLFSAATYALSMLMARRLSDKETASVMASYQNGVYLIGALIIAGITHLIGVEKLGHPSLDFLVRSWSWPTLADFLAIASCGVIAAIGVTLLTQAYRIAKASIVGSFEYTGMLWAPLWGFLFFGEIPYLTTLVGALLIIGGGLIALLGREGRTEASA